MCSEWLSNRVVKFLTSEKGESACNKIFEKNWKIRQIGYTIALLLIDSEIQWSVKIRFPCPNILKWIPIFNVKDRIWRWDLKFMFSKRRPQIVAKSSSSIWRLFSAQVSNQQCEDYVTFCDLLRKHEIWNKLRFWKIHKKFVKYKFGSVNVGIKRETK